MNTPAILSIPLKELVIDLNGDGHPKYAGRSNKEIAANAKAKTPEIESFGGWNPNYPGVVFKGDDGKWHLAAGFSRKEACETLGFKTGFFAETANDAHALRLIPFTSNSGTAISPRERGRLFVEMRDGNEATAKKGEVILAPMTSLEIANETKFKRQWVDACIGIYEETPEIAALIEADEVTSGAITRARQIAKNEDKTPDDAGRLKLLKAAIKNAKDDGRPRAAEDDVNAVRHDLFPIKADAPKKGKPAMRKKDPALAFIQAALPSDKGELGFTTGGRELFEDASKSVEPSKKTVKQAKEIAGAIFEQCFADKTLSDFDAFLVSLNNAGVQLSLSAL